MGQTIGTYNDPVGDGDSPDGAFRAIHLLETASLHLREPRRMAVKIGRRLRKQRGASDLEQLAECQNYPSSGLLAGVLDTLPEAGLEVVGIDRLVSARLDWARRLKARFSAFRSDYALLCRRSRGGGGG